MYSREQVAASIDHTLLKTTSTPEEFLAFCREAAEANVYAVCVPPASVRDCAVALRGSGVKVATVIGFPNGYSTTEVKACESSLSVEDGADEVDMVINIGRAKAKDAAYLQADIKAVVLAAQAAGKKAGKAHIPVKVIIETAALTGDEKELACKAAKAAGADFVKTSTGFGGGGATVEDVKLMRAAVGPEMGIKASGGVRSLDQLLAMLDASATRIGTSSGAAILKEYDARYGEAKVK